MFKEILEQLDEIESANLQIQQLHCVAELLGTAAIEGGDTESASLASCAFYSLSKSLEIHASRITCARDKLFSIFRGMVEEYDPETTLFNRE